MPIEVTIRILSDEEGQISDLEKNVLASLSGGQTAVTSGGITVNGPLGVTAEEIAEIARKATGGKPSGTVTGEVAVDVVAPDAEKPAEAPKRKRRTKAEIEAEIEADEAAKKAAEEAETPKAEEETGEDTAPSSESGDADLPAEETSTEPDGQPDGEAEKAEGPTVEEAVARAAKFMRDGRGPEAKAALDRVGNGAERVSKLDPKDVPAYMAALDELESL